MALVLGLKQGADFYVEDEQFVVTKVRAPMDYLVTRVADNRLFEVTDRSSVELLPNVYASAGDRPQPWLARIALEAPRAIRIKSGKTYREQQANT